MPTHKNMGLFSKRKYKTYLLVLLGLLATTAFFIPPEFCALYFELCKEFEFLVHFDKVFHFMFFTALALNTPLTKNIFGKIAIFIAISLLGISIEMIQYYTTYRGASPQDLLANVLGVFFGFTLRFFRH